MQVGPSLSGLASGAAQNILNSLLGDVFGWVILLAFLSPFLLILYVALKKSRWRDLYTEMRDPRRTKVVVRTAYGLPQKVQDKLLGDLASPDAHTEMTKLDLSDPQARAKVEQFLQGIGAMDPAAKEKLEQALRLAEAGHGKASFTLYRSEQVRLGDAASGAELLPESGIAPPSAAGPTPGSPPPLPSGPTLLDGAPISTPPPAHGPTLLGGAPDWHQGLQEKWQRERDDLAQEERAALLRNLDRNRAALQALLRPVRYGIVGLCGLAVAACLLKGRVQSQYNILALVLAGCAIWAWFGFHPDDVA